MLLKLFKSGQPALLILIPFLTGLLWLKYFILPQPVSLAYEPHPMPFYHWISALLENRLILGKLITLALLVWMSLLMARLNTRFILLGHRTYLPSVIYLLLASSYLPLQELNPAVFAGIFLVLGIGIMFGAFRKEGLALEFFLTSFLVSMASLFYARAAFLMLVVWTGLAILRTVAWREWSFTFLGFLVPYLFLFSWYYLSGQDLAENWECIRFNFVHDRGFEYLNTSYYLFYAYLLLVLLMASRKMLGTYKGLKIYIRKFFQLNFWIFAIITAFFLLIYSRAVEMIIFLAVPVAYILSYYFFNIRSKLAGEILFSLLVAGYLLILVFN